MHANRFGISCAALVAVVSVISLAARADDKAMEEQYQALAGQRTRAELSCRKSIAIMDSSRSGWQEATLAIDDLRNRIADTFGKAIRAEQVKAEGDRNAALIDELNGQMQQLDQDWQGLVREREKLGNSYTLIVQQTANARAVFDGLSGGERAWKDAGMDLTALGGAYDSVTRCVDEHCTSAEQIINQLKTRQKDWEGKLAAATKAVAPAK